MTAYIPRGVIPANLLPFTPDMKIDAPAYRQHLRDLAAVEGITAITTNGHAAEVHALSADEQREVLDITLDELGDDLPVISGIYADDSLNGARLARLAETAGARCLLIFPPQPFIMGAQRRPEMVLTHFATIASATDLPLIAFNYPLAGGQGYATDTLVRLAEAVPSVVAMKDWCNDGLQHTTNINALHSLGRPFSVLSTHSAWLLSSLVLGCDGLLSGMGSVVADLQVALWQAVQRCDLAEGPAPARASASPGAGLLRRPGRGHAQPHEGGPGALGQTKTRGRAPTPDIGHPGRARTTAPRPG